MIILAIDYGAKRIGLAKGGLENKIAFPFKTLINRGLDQASEEIVEICRGEKIEKIVIGLPWTLKGGESEQTKEVRRFANYVKIETGLETVFWDERLSTKEAMKNSVLDLDKESARIILQAYLDNLKIKSEKL